MTSESSLYAVLDLIPLLFPVGWATTPNFVSITPFFL